MPRSDTGAAADRYAARVDAVLAITSSARASEGMARPNAFCFGSVCLPRQIEMRQRAVDMRRNHGAGGPNV